MFQIFKKKEQYGKVSSKFKEHFQRRESKFNIVTSNETKISQKMKIFNQLINDNQQIENKKNVPSFPYFRQKGKIKSNEMEQRQINDLLQMSDGFAQWTNLKHQKNKIKQNLFGWSNFKDQKNQANQKEQTTFKQVFQERFNLRQLRMTHRTERFQTDLKVRIQNHVFSKSPEKPFNMTYRTNPKKSNYFASEYSHSDKKRRKLLKYFKEMKEFNNFDKLRKDGKENITFQPINKKIYQTCFNSPGKFRSRVNTPLNLEKIESNQQSGKEPQNHDSSFKDDIIYEKTKHRDPNSKINASSNMPNNLLISLKPNIKSREQNMVKINSQCQKYELNQDKVNAVKKIKCL